MTGIRGLVKFPTAGFGDLDEFVSPAVQPNKFIFVNLPAVNQQRDITIGGISYWQVSNRKAGTHCPIKDFVMMPGTHIGADPEAEINNLVAKP
jgi:hypothetical protein